MSTELEPRYRFLRAAAAVSLLSPLVERESISIELRDHYALMHPYVAVWCYSSQAVERVRQHVLSIEPGAVWRQASDESLPGRWETQLASTTVYVSQIGGR